MISPNATPLNQFLYNWKSECPDHIDLTKESHGQIVRQIADSILQNNYTLKDIDEVETQLIEEHIPTIIFLLLALKLSRSKFKAASTHEDIKVTVVFAVYKEHQRILPSSLHPHGEDFLRRKVKQINWLFDGCQNIKWELVVVDDGCPEGSGKIAQEIIDQDGLHEQVKVLFLADAIDRGLEPTIGLSSTNDSQKGGSITYGMWDAIQKNHEKQHIVVFTDADLSTHLGQLMLLVDPILNQNKSVAIGSRREKRSIVIKQGSRNNRGKLFIYLWKKMIPNLGDIIDTQCGFKAFNSSIIPYIIKDMIEKKFAFDIELLLRAQQVQKGTIEKVPIAWIDSEAASTTTDLQPYLPMLKSIAKMSKRYFPDHASENEFITLVESIDDMAFAKLLENIPDGITSRQPSEFTNYNGVTSRDLHQIISN